MSYFWTRRWRGIEPLDLLGLVDIAVVYRTASYLVDAMGLAPEPGLTWP